MMVEEYGGAEDVEGLDDGVFDVFTERVECGRIEDVRGVNKDILVLISSFVKRGKSTLVLFFADIEKTSRG